MTRASVRMALVALVALAAYGLALALLLTIPGADVVQPWAIGWGAVFAVATTFAAWNVWDSLLDARAAYRSGETQRIIAGGLWRLRSDALQGASCTAMAAVGALAIVLWGGVEVRSAMIAAAGLTLAANQVWNRIDRERVLRMPLNVEGERYHAAQAKIRRLEADAALEAAKKHDALAELAPLRAYVQILQRVLRKHGMEIPLEGRFPLEGEPQQGQSDRIEATGVDSNERLRRAHVGDEEPLP